MSAWVGDSAFLGSGVCCGSGTGSACQGHLARSVRCLCSLPWPGRWGGDAVCRDVFLADYSLHAPRSQEELQESPGSMRSSLEAAVTGLSGSCTACPGPASTATEQHGTCGSAAVWSPLATMMSAPGREEPTSAHGKVFRGCWMLTNVASLCPQQGEGEQQAPALRAQPDEHSPETAAS